MTAAVSIRRTLLCCLALCFAGTGLSPYLARSAEAEAEVKAEEVVAQVTHARQAVRRVRKSVPGALSEPNRIALAATRPASSPLAAPTLRALGVRIQV